MENKLLLDIVTPYGHVMTDDVDEVVAPGSEGEFGVLPGHTPFMTTLKVGMLTYRKDNSPGHVFINSGYAEVGPDKVLILADSAEKSGDIDVERAQGALKRAEERLRGEKDIDFTRAQIALERAITRIRVVEKD